MKIIKWIIVLRSTWSIATAIYRDAAAFAAVQLLGRTAIIESPINGAQ